MVFSLGDCIFFPSSNSMKPGSSDEKTLCLKIIRKPMKAENMMLISPRVRGIHGWIDHFLIFWVLRGWKKNCCEKSPAEDHPKLVGTSMNLWEIQCVRDILEIISGLYRILMGRPTKAK